jgi:hypothetical protein
MSADATPGSRYEISIVPFPASVVTGSDYEPVPFSIGPSCILMDDGEDAIPTVSGWGLIVLALLLVTGIKIKFGRRGPKTADIGGAGRGGSALRALPLALALAGAPSAALGKCPNDCDDRKPCTYDWCDDRVCRHEPKKPYGDVAGADGCVPDGVVDEFDVAAIEAGAQGISGPGCLLHNMDINSSVKYQPDGEIDLFDINAVLSAFTGEPGDPCKPEGACCWGEGTCTQETEDDCTGSGGSFHEGEPCEPLGACCVPGGTCVQTRDICCADVQSRYKGNGVPCDPDPCCRVTLGLAENVVCLNESIDATTTRDPAEGTCTWSPIYTGTGRVEITAHNCSATIKGTAVSSATDDVTIKVVYDTTDGFQCHHETKLTVVVVELESLTFASDHGLMRDNNSDWKGTGTVYSEPEWVKGGANNPISHTKDQASSLSLKVTVAPGDAPASTYNVKGAGPTGFTFDKDVSLSGGVNNIALTSTDKLADKIHTLNDNITWTIKRGTETCLTEDTGNHNVYVTAGTPGGSVITEKRVKYVVTLCDQLIKAHPSAKKIHDSTATYSLGATVPNPIWNIAGGARAECHKLSKFYKLAVEMLGHPAGSVVYLYPKPNLAAKEAPDGGSRHRRGDGVGLGFEDGGGGSNRYEGAFKYTADGVTEYYAGGAGIYSTPLECMEDIVVCTYWKEDLDPRCGGFHLERNWP